MEVKAVLEHLRNIHVDIAKLSTKVETLAADTGSLKADVEALLQMRLS